MQAVVAFIICLLASAVTVANATPKRGWTVQDIVEHGEITSVALAERSREVGFIVKRSSLAEGKVRFGFYVVPYEGGAPRKLLEADYLDDVSPRPRSDRWTLRADVGKGAQLYEVGRNGELQPLIVTERTAPVGGFGGMLQSAHEETRPVGVVSYQWSPDGSALWYSRLQLRDADQQRTVINRGIVYDSATMSSLAFNKQMTLVGTELRLWRSGEDRLLTMVPADAMNDFYRFTRSSVSWAADGLRLQYSDSLTSADGKREFARFSVDVASAQVQRVPGDAPLEALYGVAAPDGKSFLTVREDESGQRLVAVGVDGKVSKDHGVVAFSRVGAMLGASWNAAGDRAILGASYRDHDGLVMFPKSPVNDRWAKNPDHFANCAFDAQLKFGVCVRENLSSPQELVAITPANGDIKTLARPNAGFDDIEPLVSERREWTNKFGSVSDGYVTYPRAYVAGRKYPVVLDTHGRDARNRFVYYGFQSEVPVQVLAESGYVVLSVNDPMANVRTRKSREAFLRNDGATDVQEMQFYKNIEPLAGMETALQWAIDRGLVDPEQAGIAGYSRGCEVVEYALSQSKMFKAGSNGDAGGWGPAGYWLMGADNYVGLYQGMFGGSAYDPAAVENYRKHSAVYRASQFAGPLLQQSAARSAMFGLELHMMLRQAKIPNEFVYYPEESHILWHPQRRAAAMNRNLDWFNYWLLGKRDTAAGKQEQYRRWDAMATEWRQVKNTVSNGG